MTLLLLAALNGASVSSQTIGVLGRVVDLTPRIVVRDLSFALKVKDITPRIAVKHLSPPLAVKDISQN